MPKMFPATREAYELFHKGTLALSKIEAAGVKIDETYLHSTIDKTEKKIKRLERKLVSSKLYKKYWKPRFRDKTNLGSREQLGEVLFKEMGFQEPEKYTLMGSTDAEVLEDVDHSFVRTYVKRAKLEKLLSTYLYGIRKELCRGFVHCNYNLNTVITYRSSANDPNLQNQANRDQVMAEILRRCFIARRDNYRIAEFDYSGIEVNVGACYHEDPTMIRYIMDPTTDMHRDTAIECFMIEKFIKGLDPAQLKALFKEPEFYKMRHCGKNMFVFPQFYGDWFKACAYAMWQAMSPNKMNIMLPNGKSMLQHLASKGITKLGVLDDKSNPEPGTFMAHIQKVEKSFWNDRFPVYTQWKKDNWAEFQRLGYLVTKTGFRVAGNMTRNEINNTGTQGSAFHCMLWSLIECQRIFEKRRLKTQIIGEIHDSFLTDGPAKEFDEVKEICLKVMTKKLLKHWDWIIVPMKVEVEAAPPGASWFEKEPVPLAA